jgi:hypothetical protein
LADWEQECCGSAIERQQIVALSCKRYVGPDRGTILAVSRHEPEPGELVRGWVTDLHVALTRGAYGRSFAFLAAEHCAASTARTTATWKIRGPARSYRRRSETSL